MEDKGFEELERLQTDSAVFEIVRSGERDGKLCCRAGSETGREGYPGILPSDACPDRGVYCPSRDR